MTLFDQAFGRTTGNHLFKLALPAFAALLLTGATASAETLYSNLDDITDVLASTSDYPGAEFVTGDHAMLLEEINAQVLNATTEVQPLTFKIYSDSGGSPSTVLTSQTFSMTVTTGPQTVTGDLTNPIYLTANTDYWFVEYSSGDTEGNVDTLATSSSMTEAGTPYANVPGSETAISDDGGNTFFNSPTSYRTSYSLVGEVPEPTTWASMILGLVALGGFARIRARSKSQA